MSYQPKTGEACFCRRGVERDMIYRGWSLGFNPRRPVTGTWKATRDGVTLCAASQTALQTTVDNHIRDRAVWIAGRKT